MYAYNNKMKYQQLGTSDLHISQISFGCMSLKPGVPASKEVLQRAVDAGINYFDTADLYDKGLNEELVGQALNEKRKEIILATKVGNQWREDGSGWDWNPDKNYILESVEKSLNRLGTDYIDLYQLHGGTLQDSIDEIIEVFELLVQQGKIRYYGISSIRPAVIREWAQRSRIISVMTQYSLLDRRPEETVLPLLQQKKIGVLTRGSIAQGLLIDKEPREYLGYNKKDVEKAAAGIRSVSVPHRTPAQTALQFALSNPAVTSAVVGIRTQEQLEEAAQSVHVPALTLQELAFLQMLISPNYYQEHR